MDQTIMEITATEKEKEKKNEKKWEQFKRPLVQHKTHPYILIIRVLKEWERERKGLRNY